MPNRLIAHLLLALALLLPLLTHTPMPGAAPTVRAAELPENVWRGIGPEGGLLYVVAIDPKTPATIYAGTYGGRIFKTLDAGANWVDISHGVSGYAVTAMVINPDNPQTVYAALGYSLYRSQNGGASWQQIGATINGHVSALAIDPTNPQILYAGRTFSLVNGAPGVFRSLDGGTTWLPAETGLTDTKIAALVIDPANPAVVYAGYAGLYRSSDYGRTWQALTNGLPSDAIIHSLAFDNTVSPAAVYAAVYSTINLGVYTSTNAGALWAKVSEYQFGKIKTDPSAPGRLYATNTNGPYHSVDGGVTWQALWNGLPGSIVTDIAITPQNPAVLYVATYNGVYKSTNAGAQWGPAIGGFSGAQINTLAVDPANAAVIYAGTSGGIYKTTDGGANWAFNNNGISGNVFIESLAIDPAVRSTVYAGSYGVVYRSLDSGANWSLISTGTFGSGGFAEGDVTDLTIDPLNTSTLYARLTRSSKPGIYKSVNGGVNWNRVINGIPEPSGNSAFQALAIDPVTPATLYTGTFDGIYRTSDGGANWQPITTGLPDLRLVSALAVDPVNPAVVYAGVATGIYKSENSGKSWRLAIDAGAVRTLLVDPTDHLTIYAGVNSGLLRSTDGGESWNSFNTGVTVPTATSLALVPAAPIQIFAGTSNAGIFSLRFSLAGVSLPAPRGVLAARPFSLLVSVLGSDGSTATGYNGPLKLALAGGTPGAQLGGVLTSTAVKGVARFSDLTISAAGGGYRLRATAGDLAGGVSAPFAVATSGQSGSVNEAEPNQTLAGATQLLFDASGLASATGTVSATTDVDLFSFTAQPGAEVNLRLTGLRADNDLILLSDPRVANVRSDGTDLGNISDIARDSIARDSIARDSIARDSIARDSISGISANPGDADEAISAFLPRGGSYFVLVLSGASQGEGQRPYRLEARLTDGALNDAVIAAQSGRGIPVARDPAVRTIFLANFARMRALYTSASQSQALAALPTALTDPRLLGPSDGVLLDISRGLDPAAAERLETLYRRWDASPDQPLLANEVARQIWFILDQAISIYYPNTTAITVIGGDDVIPFYRVPDETTLGNERDYQRELQATGALSATSPLAGSLRFSFYQTDDYYADRKPTPWRGRALFVPDQAIGRLVEQPGDILGYLQSYLAAPAADRFTVRADRASAPAGAAFVTGYDFLTDEANQIASTLGTYGLAGARLTRLIAPPAWNAAQLADLWFGGQLPELEGSYRSIQTPFDLSSLNAHFSHYAALPADLKGGTFAASRLYTPTPASAAAAFFKRNGAPTLLYSVGCHAGLSASDSAFTDAAYRADFPQAVMKQGGNWVGNTGYGIGDTDWAGYSERLALLFTQAIGHDSEPGAAYTGAPIGAALAEAKRQYLQTSGPNGFGLFDEKIMGQVTLYGLPFIKVKVPTPRAITELAAPLAPANSGILTREITFEIELEPLAGPVPQVGQVTISDSLSATPRELLKATVTGEGRPVLPALVYDLTLAPNSATGRSPEVRGVRLKRATSAGDIANFDPHVTTPITDETLLAAPPETQLVTLGAWLPERPYTFQRTMAVVPGGAELVGGRPTDITDKLIVVPAQFHAETSSIGRLRRFTRMVFEVSYIDPQTAPRDIVEDTQGPVFELVAATTLPATPQQTDPPRTQLRARVVGDATLVSATYSSDGRNWQRVNLAAASSGDYSATVAADADAPGFAVFFEAQDRAGNVTVAAPKASIVLRSIRLPMVRR